MFDPVAEIKIYADEALTRELSPSDIIDASKNDNVVDLYIAFDDDVSDAQRMRIVELFGSNIGLYFDVVREHQGQYFRDFSMVESVEVRTIFKTERTIKAFSKRIGDYAYMNVAMMYAFDFEAADFMVPYVHGGKLDAVNLFSCPIHKAYSIMFPLGRLYIDEEDPKRYLVGRYSNRNMLVWTNDPMRILALASECGAYTPSAMEDKPDGPLLEWLFTSDYIDKTMRRSRRIILNTFLYGNGAFGTALNTMKDMRPTMYETLTAFASDPPNASYALAQMKREIGPRWVMWNQSMYESGVMMENISTYRCDYGIVTRHIGLGIVDTADRLNFFASEIQASGTSCDNGGEALYYIANGTGSARSLATYTYAVTHRDGTVNGIDYYRNGSGSEYAYFGTIAYMCDALGISEDEYYKALSLSVAKKGVDIIKSCVDDFAVRNQAFCEFYDLEHACPFDGVETYVPIPLNLASMQRSDIYAGRKRSLEKKYASWYKDSFYNGPGETRTFYFPGADYVDVSIRCYIAENITNLYIYDINGTLIKQCTGRCSDTVRVIGDFVKITVTSSLHTEGYRMNIDLTAGTSDDPPAAIEVPENGIAYEVYKRRYEEDEYGNVTLVDLPVERYPIGTFAIPFNKNEYVHKVFVKKAFHTFVSRDHVVHIRVRFKKMPNRMQNIRFRIFSADHVFAKEILVDV